MYYPHALCVRRGTSLEVHPYRYLNPSEEAPGATRTDRADPVLLPGVFEDKAAHSFRAYRDTVRRVCGICGASAADTLALVWSGGVSALGSRSWTLQAR